MDDALILRKSAAGLAEVEQRRQRLPMRTRALLIMLDGSTALSDLRQRMLAFGAVEEDLQRLLDLGLVEPALAAIPAAPVAAEPLGVAAAPQSARRSLALARLYLMSVMERALAYQDAPVRECLRTATTRDALLSVFGECRAILLELGGVEHAATVERRLAEILP